jgi:hypothetical protein
MSIRNRILSCALAVSALAPSAPASASAGTLTSTRFGAVDFGDRIAYRVAGPGCEGAHPRVVVTVPGGNVAGPASNARTDGVDPSGCTGAARVPSFSEVRAAGWRQGDKIDIALREGGESVPLRYFRIEADQGQIAAGAPTVGPAGDQDTGDWDKALTMGPGDSVSLGRVDVERLDALSLRLCVPTGVDGPVNHLPPEADAPGRVGGYERIETPVIASVRQGSPTGPALVGPIDISSNPTNVTRLATAGFHGCYRLLHLPITGRIAAESPELFVTVDAAPPGVLQLNSVDVDGTGAKLPARGEEDPAGMQPIFDGTSWKGWTQTGCQLNDDGSVSHLRSGAETDVAPCSMSYDRPLGNAVFRFELRRRNFFDNGTVLFGTDIFNDALQLRSAGEWGAGGYLGGYAARALKLNSWPDWSEMQVAKLGSRYVVTVNGRTVTDYVRPEGAPDTYNFSLATEPEWSYRTGVANGFGHEGTPDVERPSEWGDFWFRNVRVLECAGAADPKCLALADANAGQVPRH